jgi:HAD superfamily hydrolase (TIGR01662 family)
MTAATRTSFGASRGAVFFDRDGTLIRHHAFIKNPDDVVLVPHASQAVRYINYALHPVVVVTNESGIARGLTTELDYGRIKARLDDVLAERNASIEASYFCPHHPDFTGPCACRKPGTALYERAMAELNLDPAKCAYIGDRWHDIEAAQTLGGQGILVPSPVTPGEEVVRAARELQIAATLTAAVHAILGSPPAKAAS